MAEAERIKPRALYAEEAIQLALESNWTEAVTVNRAVLDRYGPDEDAYNRLGKALFELGRLEEALEAYGETLKLNPLNVIAQKNQRKLSAMLTQPARVEGVTGSVDVDLFAEEPGKSALTVLSRPSGGVLVQVAPGDPVDLDPVGGLLRATTVRGVVLGDVEAKISRRLLPLMESGNRYSAAVARAEDDNRIQIMIREAFQSPENARKSSFPIARGKREEFRPYAKESLLASRGSDWDSIEAEEDEGIPGGTTPDEGEEEFEGMQTVESDAEDGSGSDFDEEPDEDSRPEDQY
ncbi:MAG TPA: tetratricopeptide repeat protein [Candidatus Dormibacteraeota bacterium]|nr:tetratricopeptide repeat protein [Candidatus Dormibacteraeota bacterium]